VVFASIATFAAAFVASLVGLLVMEKLLAPRLGLLDHPGGRKQHAAPTPLGGGVGIWLGTLVPVAGGYVVARLLAGGWAPGWIPGFVRLQAPLVLQRGQELWALLLGGTVIMLLGLADDRWDLSPRLRLAAQVAVALGAFLATPRLRITVFSPHPVAWGVFTVGWIVLITNSFNFLDTMDGLSGGVALIATGLLTAGAVATGQYFVALFLLAFGGATAAFLARNFPPAKIFAGSSGAYFFGFLLAVSTIAFTFYEPGRPLAAAVVPVLVLSVAIYDTASVMLIRLREGRPLMVGDRKHLSHRLEGLGMTRREAVLTHYLLAFCAGCPALLLLDLRYKTSLVVAESLAVLALMAIMEMAGRRRGP
jgi:UDP-GlcNAc:undecaprenyl-phosphate GlcNAc-1-phosphate transferase